MPNTFEYTCFSSVTHNPKKFTFIMNRVWGQDADKNILNLRGRVEGEGVASVFPYILLFS